MFILHSVVWKMLPLCHNQLKEWPLVLWTWKKKIKAMVVGKREREREGRRETVSFLLVWPSLLVLMKLFIIYTMREVHLVKSTHPAAGTQCVCVCVCVMICRCIGIHNTVTVDIYAAQHRLSYALKEILHTHTKNNFCYYLLILISFQMCMLLFLMEHKVRFFFCFFNTLLVHTINSSFKKKKWPKQQQKNK